MAEKRWWVRAPGPPSHRMDSIYGKDTPFTDSTYMREVQRRRDSDYKSQLRLKERERMQAEQKREQRAAQPLAQPTIKAGRSYEKPWIKGMTNYRKVDIVDTEARDSASDPRTLFNGRGSKFPSLYNIMGKKQKYPQLADVADNKGGVSSGPDHGTAFQAQRLQPKGKRGPAVSQQQQLKGSGPGLVAGTAPGPPVRRAQSRTLCCEVSAEEEEEATMEAGAKAEGDDEPEPPASAAILASAPVPAQQPPSILTAGGKGEAQKEEGARPREQGPAQPSRQQTSLNLRRLRQERLPKMGAQRGEEKEQEVEQEGSEQPPVLSGTVDGLPTANMAAAKMATDRLPFHLRVRRSAAAQEKGSGASFSRAAAEAPSEEEGDKGAVEEEEGGRWANDPRALRPSQAEPAASANRGTQTLRGRCPPQTPQCPAPQPPVSTAPLLLPRLESGRLVSFLVTTTAAAAVASPGMVTVATPSQQACTTRLQPISATRHGAAPPAGSAPSSWGQGREPLPLSMAILALSELRAPDRAATTAGEARKEEERVNEKPCPDPERLKKLQESLLHEDLEEEEGDVCRICLIPGGTPLNPLLEPCKCVGSLQFVHHDCLKKWLQAKIISGANLAAVTTCELCKNTLKLDFDNFDVHEFHRKRAASQIQVEEEMSSSSLYMAVLLHLYEQRFTELMRLLSSSAMTYQFSTADSQPGANGSDVQNSDSEEEDGTDLQPRGTLVPDSLLVKFEQRDA